MARTTITAQADRRPGPAGVSRVVLPLQWAAVGEATRRLRWDIAYDGGAFHGWARQPGLRTVQGVLEEALARLLPQGQTVPGLTVAGRTDAGVHASGQVAHVDLTPTQWEALTRPHARPHGGRQEASPTPGAPVFEGAGRKAAEAASQLCRRLNGALRSRDVVVTGVRPAAEGFDARFSALWRSYVYRVADGVAHHDPLQRHRSLWHPTELDVQSMDRAAHSLLGLQDFAAFCKAREGATTIRELQDFRWVRTPEGVEARVRADAFCHGMVRSLVGACLAVGEGRLTPVDLTVLRDAGRRPSVFAVAPAHGLTLTAVGYPPDGSLAARSRQTRALRTLVRPDGPQTDPGARPGSAELN